jgi:hypothetical protein
MKTPKPFSPVSVTFKVNYNTKIEIFFGENMRMDTFLVIHGFYRKEEGKKWMHTPECKFSLDEVLATRFAKRILKAVAERKADVLKKKNVSYQRLLNHYTELDK